jgi:hypothetical protein
VSDTTITTVPDDVSDAFDDYANAQSGEYGYDETFVYFDAEAGHYVGRFSSYDPYSHMDNPLDDVEGVTFHLFDNGAERDAWLIENIPGAADATTVADLDALLGDRRFLVERYEHGQVRYSTVAAGYHYPDRRWDVAVGVGVIELDDQWVSDGLRVVADIFLDQYSSWCNGDVYSVTETTFNPVIVRGIISHLDVEEEYTTGGYFGNETAAEAVRTGV